MKRFSDPRLDSAQTVFFNRELEHIEAEALNPKYAKLEALGFVSALPGLDATAMQTTYRSFDVVGEARRAATPTDDAPTVNLFGVETTSYFQWYHSGFEYSLDEVRAGAQYNRPLDRDRSNICRDILARKLDALVSNGDSDIGTKGLTNLSGTSTYTIPANGTGSSKLWTTKTPDQIIEDIGLILDALPAGTAEIENATRILMPPTLLRFLERKRTGSSGDNTLMKFIKDNFPGIQFAGWQRLNYAGAAGVGRIMAYNPMIENVRVLLPVPFEQLEPERQGGGWKVTQRFKYGGVVAPYPKSILYADGASPAAS